MVPCKGFCSLSWIYHSTCAWHRVCVEVTSQPPPAAGCLSACAHSLPPSKLKALLQHRLCTQSVQGDRILSPLQRYSWPGPLSGPTGHVNQVWVEVAGAGFSPNLWGGSCSTGSELCHSVCTCLRVQHQPWKELIDGDRQRTVSGSCELSCLQNCGYRRYESRRLSTRTLGHFSAASLLCPSHVDF